MFTNVEDATSGLSTNTDKYQYSVDEEVGFGSYENLLHCNTPWVQDSWVDLEDFVTTNGVNSAYLKTQKTDFCNNNWKICKNVRFYAEDMAGNTRTKDLCINGPWIKVRGGGIVRADYNIDMVSEAPEDNADGLIEVGNLFIDFFSTSTNWEIDSAVPPSTLTYQDLYDTIIGTRVDISSNTELPTVSGVYEFGGDLVLNNQFIPNTYDNATFDQVIFVDGTLTIAANISIDTTSAVLFVVKNNVFIDENVTEVHAGVIADANFETAYNLAEGKSTQALSLFGFFVAEDIKLQRTLQGTNNETNPSESFFYEPKYVIQMKDFFSNNDVIWESVQ